MTSSSPRSPKYRVVESALRARIAAGSPPQGAKLPSEHALAEEFGVAYGTMRQAISGLVREGLLLRVQGSGTFVRFEGTAQAALTLALIVPSLPGMWNVAGFYYLPPIVQGFCLEATRLGYEPTVLGGIADISRLARNSPESLCGIACLLTHEEDNAIAEKLSDLGLPLVCINSYHGRRALASIAADQKQGMEEVVALLARHGHRRIAFLPGTAGNLGPLERLAAFRAAMQRHGLEPLFPSKRRPDEAQTQAAEASVIVQPLLARSQPPTAIVAAGDMLALGTLQALQQTALRVPEDISLVGFGDYHFAPFLQPPLTTVRLPLTQLGTEAALYLDRRLSDHEKRRHILLPVELMERGTVGPAPARAPSAPQAPAPTPILPSPRFLKQSRA